MEAQLLFVRRKLIAPLEPAPAAGAPRWLHQSLFGSVLNTVLTLVTALAIVLLVWPAAKFLIFDAVWSGSSREDCIGAETGSMAGACWPFIAAKFSQFMFGFYPEAEQWRVEVTYALGLVLI